jgi:hypothetical protein
MALKTVLDSLKNDGHIIKKLDMYLLTKNTEDSGRAIDVNSPSSSGGCVRASYYSRTGAEKKSNSIEPRTRRIFDNGTFVHNRLQEYLKDMGMLLIDEVPVIDKEYEIQGHTDGILQLPNKELAILEIKSINDGGFKALKTAKEEHKLQGLVYLHCLEKRRHFLRNKYTNLSHFRLDKKNRFADYASHYTHLKGGSKYTTEEKLNFQCSLHSKIDKLLFETEVPITRVIFLYENKNDQHLKEFTIMSKSTESINLTNSILETFDYLNVCVENKELPERGFTDKNCNSCRFCDYSILCWN